MSRKKVVITLFALTLLLLITGYCLFQISKSRTFQFFGEIVLRVETSQKVVALTFDDGPEVHTREVLGILQTKDIKATFFVIGKDLERNPDIAKEIAESGHEIGNHSYSHHRMWFKIPAEIASEIENTNNLIRSAGYAGNIYFRPPYGKKLILLPWYLSQHNIKTIMWDVEPDTYTNSSDELIEYTVTNTRPGSIILLHPFCESCGPQRAALSEIIDQLHADGYTFVTITELLELR